MSSIRFPLNFDSDMYNRMENRTEINVERLEASVEMNFIRLKEQRAFRNKQKRAAKKLQKQKERDQKELILKMQPKGNNITLITRDFADKLVKNTAAAGSSAQNISVNDVDFPILGDGCKISKTSNYLPKDVEIEVETDMPHNRKCASKIELADFIYVPSTATVQVKPITQCFETYNGNALDSDLPIRKKGKFRETPKAKKLSKLKREILKDKSAHEASAQILTVKTQSAKIHLYIDYIITEELNNLVKGFISGITGLQEKLYKRDPIKGKSKRRYVIGLHEVNKYLKLNKVKMLILVPDIKLDGVLSDVIEQIIDLAKANDTPYLFALKRRLLGSLTLKFIPVSSIAVLNYEGLENQFKTIVETLLKLRNEYSQLNNTTLKATKTEENPNTELVNNLLAALK